MGNGQYWLHTLGCPKNQVDSDKLAGRLAAEGYRPAAGPGEADLVVVNTCAFIEAARQESVDAVLELADARRPGARLVVTGCMAERYGDELADALPEVDLVAGFGVALTALDGWDLTGPGDPRACPRRPAPSDRRRSDPPRRLLRPAGAPPPGGRRTLGLCEGGRGLRPHLRLLCHPLVPGATALEGHGRHPGRGGGAGRGDGTTAGVREIVLVAQDLASYGRDRTSGRREVGTG